MANTIILKKSSVAAKVPTVGDLAYGELAINYTDGKLYFKKSDGTIDAFTTASAAGVTSFNGLTGAITATDALNAIKDVDGTGSGLDADFLDGLHASSFYLASNPNGYTSNTGTVTSVTAGTGLIGGSITTSGTIALATSGVTAGTYTKITVDSYGRATSGASLSSSDVTTALGYTPYNSSNPNGYITSSGSITGSAGSVTGLTLNSSSDAINPNNVTQNQLGYNNSVNLFGQTDGGLYSSAYNSAWIHQIYGDFRTGQIAIRGKNSGTWQAWRTVLDSSNYSNYVSGGQFIGTAATKAIMYNSNTISENITIPSGSNALSSGPIIITDGYIVTVQDGAVWAIV